MPAIGKVMVEKDESIILAIFFFLEQNLQARLDKSLGSLL